MHILIAIFYLVTISATLQLIVTGVCLFPVWLLTINWVLMLYDMYIVYVRGEGRWSGFLQSYGNKSQVMMKM